MIYLFIFAQFSKKLNKINFLNTTCLIVLILSFTIDILNPRWLEAAKGAKGVEANVDYSGKGGDAKVIEVRGVAQITSAGSQDAFDRALAHAMRKAVEQVLGTMVHSETIVKNSSLIDDRIYSKSTGFVKSYQVLSDKNKGRTKILQVKVWVVLADVEKDAMALGMLQDRINKPYLVVLVNQIPFSLADFTSSDLNAVYVKNAVHQFFSAKEFQFVEESQLKSVLRQRKMNLASLSKSGNKSDLSKVALDAGAQVIIRATVNAGEQQVRSLPKNWRSIRSTVSLEAIYTADATIIASSSSSQAASTIDVASAYNSSVKRAVSAASEELFSKIIQRWSTMLSKGFEYKVLVAGISYEEARNIRLSISKNIEGIKGVFERSFSDDNLNLVVRFSGTPSDLVSMLLAEGKIPVPLRLSKYNFKSIVLYKK